VIHITCLLSIEMVPTDSVLKKRQFLPEIQWLPDMPLLFPESLFRNRCLKDIR
jgi:hypothetical protein